MLPLRGRWPEGPEGVVFCLDKRLVQDKKRAPSPPHKHNPSPGSAGPSPEGRDYTFPSIGSAMPTPRRPASPGRWWPEEPEEIIFGLAKRLVGSRYPSP